MSYSGETSLFSDNQQVIKTIETNMLPMNTITNKLSLRNSRIELERSENRRSENNFLATCEFHQTIKKQIIY